MKTERLHRLSLEDQVELGKRMSEGDKKAREMLVLACVPLVKTFASTSLCNCYSTYDDVFQDGMLGVLEAVDKYDYKRNVMFTTFAYHYINKRVLDGVVKQSPIKISQKDYFNFTLINSTVESFHAAFQTLPTNEQLSQLTAIPLDTVKLLRKQNPHNMVVPFDELKNDVSADLLPSGDLAILVEKTLNHSNQKSIIANALNSLLPEEREFIKKRYLYEERKSTLKEIALKENISFQAISKREKKVLKKLLTYFVNHNIKFEDLI